MPLAATLVDELLAEAKGLIRIGGPAFQSKATDYDLGEVFGRGTFGAVYSGRNKKSGEKVAVKQVLLLILEMRRNVAYDDSQDY